MDRTIKERLFEADIASLQVAMELGTLTAVDCVNWYLERIERFNPILKAVLEVNPDAMAIAKALDEERQKADLAVHFTASRSYSRIISIQVTVCTLVLGRSLWRTILR